MVNANAFHREANGGFAQLMHSQSHLIGIGLVVKYFPSLLQGLSV